MYGALYRYLDDEGITASDIDRMQRAVKADDRLGDEIFSHIWEQVENLVRLSLSKSGFCCGVEAQALMKIGQSSSELAVKKLASISTTSFIHCGSINRYSGDVHEGYSLSWAGFGTFLQLAFRYRPLVEGNLIIPTAEYSFTENTGDFEPELVTHADLRKDALKIDLDISEVEQQFFETSAGNFQTPVGSVEILLPHLRNVEIETIVRLRSEEQDAFIRYHRHLSSFFRESSKLNNEQSIVECLQRIDQGIRDTEAAFKSMRTINLYSGLGVAVGLASAVLCLFMPHDIAEYIRAVVGGATGVAAFKYLASRQRSLRELRNADFYFPWLLHRAKG